MNTEFCESNPASIFFFFRKPFFPSCFEFFIIRKFKKQQAYINIAEAPNVLMARCAGSGITLQEIRTENWFMAQRNVFF
jgi:hypothetical protein